MKKLQKKQTLKVPKRRNHVALALQRRGGAGKHGPTSKMQRLLDKVQTALLPTVQE